MASKIINSAISPDTIQQWVAQWCRNKGQSCITILGNLFTLCATVTKKYTVTWYWWKDGYVLRLRRWSQAWRKVMAAQCQGNDLKSHLQVDYLYTGISSGTNTW